jgi:hypothetical protein
MPRGDKSKYTEKQKRQAEHIEEGYEQRGNDPFCSYHYEIPLSYCENAHGPC